MNNADIAERLEEAMELMELMDVNVFKINAFRKLSQSIENESTQLPQLTSEEIGRRFSKGMAAVISEIIQTGTFSELLQMEREIPEGVRSMLRINGIGPKKVRHLWKEAGIDTLDLLRSSCQSGTIALQKGFGEKIQQSILEGIGFLESVQGRLLQHKADAWASALEAEWEKAGLFGFTRTGNLVLWPETIASLDFLFPSSQKSRMESWLDSEKERFLLLPEKSGPMHYYLDFPEAGSSLLLHFAAEEELNKTRFVLASEAGHWQLAAARGIPLYQEWKKGIPEDSIYASLGKKQVPPELRQGWMEWEDQFQKEDNLLAYDHVRGCLHNHSTWSDGRNKIEEMASWCIQQGWEYFGIADHSQSARYANGLHLDAVHSQWAEIEQLNQRFAGSFRILKGIESDILGDGSLDYPDDVLRGFDYVVASVHSIMKMDIRTATTRLIRAIEHPSTHILGHCSGRILLRRPGYPLDYEKVIDACIANKVAIELNAHPSRLDMDLFHLRRAIEKGAMIAVNPDAHEVSGMDVMRYGIVMARKAGAPPDRVLNCLSLEKVLEFCKK
jgi:DNA polymerase (family 10)